MRRVGIGLLLLGALAAGAIAMHWALIEVGREVVVLRTREPDGAWYEARLWIVDDGDVAWLHGNDVRWMRNLEARPLVEIVRGGETLSLRASPVPAPHVRVHELMRAKYGLADRWVRFVGPDGPETRAVRLERLGPP